MSNESYAMNVPRFIELLVKWKTKLVIYGLLLGIISAVILFFTPNKYYSFASAVPTNAALTDKSYLFNEHINNLYPAMGSYSDLDRIYSTAILDTSYKYLIEKYHLVERYGIKGANHNIAVQKAILLLSEEDLRVEKTENGLLRIHVMHFNADTAALMANDLMHYVNDVNTNLQLDYNRNSKQALDSLLKEGKDSLSVAQLEEVNKLKHQFDITLRVQQPALRVVEAASPSLKHFKPKRLISFISTMTLGLLAAIGMIAIWESIRVQRNA